MAGDLDRVLDGLRPRVEQRRQLGEIARSEGVETLAHRHITLVGSHHEAGVAEATHLVPHRLDNRRDGVPDAGHGDPRAQVDQGIAVDVDQDGALTAFDVHGQDRADTRGHGRGPASGQSQRLRPGNLGNEMAALAEYR